MRLVNINDRAHVKVKEGYCDLESASSGQFPAELTQAIAQSKDIADWVQAGGLQDADVKQSHPSELGAPSPTPRQIFAVGLNYSAHAAETGLAGSDDIPLTFTKFASSITGPAGELQLSGDSVDWEIELVVVIGTECENVPQESAWSVVAGITVGQDYSDRAVQMTGTPPQFSLGKSFPGFAPIGPEIVTLDEFDSLDSFDMECTINGRTVQKGSTDHLIHSIPKLISLYSSVCTLYPGDLIFTGTPEGVGMGLNPPQYLQPGDIVVSRISGVGELAQTCVMKTGVSVMK